jgi:protein-tyrosine phosphatase
MKQGLQLTNRRIFITITTMMVDLHCHILPGLDDGAETLEESLRMCSMAAEDAIKTIVATPHTLDGVYMNELPAIKQAVSDLNRQLIQNHIPVEILPGADVHVNVNLLELLKEGKATTVNDNHRYLMLEFPHRSVPPNVENLIFELNLQGIIPILTHPERNMVLQNDLDLVYKLVSQGVLVQITALSLVGEFGPGAERCSRDLLKHNLAHIIATDAHSPESRPPILSVALEAAAKLMGETSALALVTCHPSAIIQGRDLPDLPEPEKPKKSFFQRLFS